MQEATFKKFIHVYHIIWMDHYQNPNNVKKFNMKNVKTTIKQ